MSIGLATQNGVSASLSRTRLLKLRKLLLLLKRRSSLPLILARHVLLQPRSLPQKLRSQRRLQLRRKLRLRPRLLPLRHPAQPKEAVAELFAPSCRTTQGSPIVPSAKLDMNFGLAIPNIASVKKATEVRHPPL